METKTKNKKTKKQRINMFFKILLIVLIVIAVILCSLVCVSVVGIKSNSNFIKTNDAVAYEEQLIPTIEDDGYYSFTTDKDFKIMQLTDVHISMQDLCVLKKTQWRSIP